MFRGANGHGLGALGTFVLRSFLGSIKVQFRAVVARDARRCFLSVTQHRSIGYAFLLQENGSYVMQQSSGTKVWVSREGSRDTCKLVCWYREKHVNTVTSLILKRELESVRRELRNSETGQHENTHGHAMTANQKLTHERSGHATFDSRCEVCVRVRGTSVSEAAFSIMPHSGVTSCSAQDRMVRRSQGQHSAKV